MIGKKENPTGRLNVPGPAGQNIPQHDIHRITVAKVLGIDPKDVTEEQRREAKAVNFGRVYGSSRPMRGKNDD